MNVLLLGSGGREHALAWKLTQSPLLTRLYIAPGNAGTAEHGENLAVQVDDFEAIDQAVKDHDIALVIVGPEVPLVQGIVDVLEAKHPDLMVVGPTASGARLEGSKAFAKEFMDKYGIPTAAYAEFTGEDLEAGLAYLRGHALPIVLKADGLAAGKGVVICQSVAEAEGEFRDMLGGKFGAASTKVVVESFLDGIEFSVFVLTDGSSYQVLPIAKDYKRIGEGDTGPNTGGMGSVSPVPFVDAALWEKVEDQVIRPTITGLKQEGMRYRGFIFFGLINVDGSPYVIEYNCRMGDPETQSVLPRLKSDLLAACVATCQDQLKHTTLELDDQSVVSIVLVSGGYPGSYEKGKALQGMDQVAHDTLIFHAGTRRDGEHIVSNGGRVVAVCCQGSDLKAALAKANADAQKIHFEGQYHRRDIGLDLI